MLLLILGGQFKFLCFLLRGFIVSGLLGHFCWLSFGGLGMVCWLWSSFGGLVSSVGFTMLEMLCLKLAWVRFYGKVAWGWVC